MRNSANVDVTTRLASVGHSYSDVTVLIESNLESGETNTEEIGESTATSPPSDGRINAGAMIQKIDAAAMMKTRKELLILPYAGSIAGILSVLVAAEGIDSLESISRASAW